MSETYEPLPNTIAGRAVKHLRSLPAGTELTSAELAEAICTDTATLSTYLASALRYGLVKRMQRRDGIRGVLWSVGDGKPLDDGRTVIRSQASAELDWSGPSSIFDVAKSVLADLDDHVVELLSADAQKSIAKLREEDEMEMKIPVFRTNGKADDDTAETLRKELQRLDSTREEEKRLPLPPSAEGVGATPRDGADPAVVENDDGSKGDVHISDFAEHFDCALSASGVLFMWVDGQTVQLSPQRAESLRKYLNYFAKEPA